MNENFRMGASPTSERTHKLWKLACIANSLSMCLQMGPLLIFIEGTCRLNYDDRLTMSVKRVLDSSYMYKGSNPMYKSRLHRLMPKLELSRPIEGLLAIYMDVQLS